MAPRLVGPASALMLCTSLFSGTGAVAAAPVSPALQHADTYQWQSITEAALSPDGRWVAYIVRPWEGEGKMIVRALDGATEQRIARVRRFEFTENSRFLVLLMSAESASSAGEVLGVIDLHVPNSFVRIATVKNFRLARQNVGWLAYTADGSPQQQSAGNTSTNEQRLVLHHLPTGEQIGIENVSAYELSRTGKYVVYFTAGTEAGAYALHIDTRRITPLLRGEGAYRQLTLDHAGSQVAFLAKVPDRQGQPSALAIYRASLGQGMAAVVARASTPGIAQGWGISEHFALSFSKNGKRLFFGTAPLPVQGAADGKAPAAKVSVDIWNWRDPYLQSMQLQRIAEERRAAYMAVLFVAAGRIVQLGDPNLQKVSVGQQGDGDVALGEDRLPYRQLISWDRPYRDFYLIDVRSGRRSKVIKKLKFKAFGEPMLSPDARYLSWWDSAKRAWFAMSTREHRTVAIAKDIPYPLHNVDYDESDDPPPFARPQWTDGGSGLVISDGYDVWLTDPQGRQEPRNLTLGLGRQRSLRFRPVPIVGIDPDDPYGEHRLLPLNRDVLLGAFDLDSKASGYYRDRWDDRTPPAALLMQDAQLPSVSGVGPQKARFADVLLFRRETFGDSALWSSDADFRDLRKLSAINPQQERFRWGSAELTSWLSADGRRLQGIVFKPQGFDSAQRYPLIVQLYERQSQDLHKYRPPPPDTSAAGVSIGFYVSRGYVVFLPDIRYKLGFPGESAADAVIPGVLALIEKGFIDAKRIGVQGHSWGGYQAVYLVTRSNLFAAAAAGAPVVNMTSAYGGIRLESGASRMWQYEHEQSRIGATLWQAPQLYLKNSPLFSLDRVQTPLLILHNDSDGAVPWSQGIELFTALRRLQKPAWLVNYNGEGHLLSARPAKDWAIRLQQFFDHRLQGARPPVWLQEGVPAERKGETLGLDLIAGGSK